MPPAVDAWSSPVGDERDSSSYPAVAQSVHALPWESRQLLAAMAVVGRKTPLPVLAMIADVADPGAALDDLVEAGFVAWFPHGLAEPVGITEPGLRDAVYRELPLPLRHVLHLAASEQLSGVDGFRHALLGTRRRDADLAARLEEEAERYHSLGDTEQAGTLLLWSADISAGPDRERRLLRLAQWGVTTATAGWAAALGQRLALVGPTVERNLFLGRLAVRETRYLVARSLFDQAAALAGDLPAPARAAVDLATTALYADTGDLDGEERTATALLAHDGLQEEQRQWARYFAADAHGRMHQSPDAALRRLESLAPELRASQTDRNGQGLLHWARGTWLAQAGRPAEAMADLHRALRSHDDAADGVLALSYAYLGYSFFQLGDWQAALREAQEGMRAADARKDWCSAIPATALAACINALRGEWDLARTHTDAVRTDQRALGPAHYEVFPALAEATMARARQESSRVLTALTPVTAQPARFALHQLWWRPLHVDALIRTGRLGQARPALATLRAAAASSAGLTTALARLEGRLTAAEGDPVTATAHLAQGVEQSTDEDSPFTVAELEEEYGRHLLLQGPRRRRSAIRWLTSAYERYEDLGARPFAERCVKQLGEVGVQLPPAAATDTCAILPAVDRAPTALTDQQFQIARLASEGMTNPQIARALFVSPRTIEYHLGNIFATLGIASRRQLRTRLVTAAAGR